MTMRCAIDSLWPTGPDGATSGSSAPRVPALRERLSPSHAVIGAEVVYGVTQEMALTLGDLLVRRTHLAFESADQALAIAPVVAELVAPLLCVDERPTAMLR